jgi:uncharacterized SAM-binding protein YcdF (DUF218 family)
MRFILSRAWKSLRFALVSVGLLLVSITVASPLLHYWTTALSAPWGDLNGDVLIVLGGDIVAPDMMGITSYWRSCYTTLAWRSGHYRRIVLAGKEIAPLMKDCITFQGVPAESIVVENNSTSTHENALYVAALLKGDTSRKVLLTSDFHMRRALSAFRRAGIEASALPIPDAHKRLLDWTQRWGIFWMLFQETSKIVYYKIEGWV